MIPRAGAVCTGRQRSARVRDSGKAVRVRDVLWIYMNVALVRTVVAGIDRSVDVPNGVFPVFQAGGAWDKLFS